MVDVVAPFGGAEGVLREMKAKGISEMLGVNSSVGGGVSRWLMFRGALGKGLAERSVNGCHALIPQIMMRRMWRHLLVAATTVVLMSCRYEGWEEVATLKTKGSPVAVAWAGDGIIATISDFGREIKLWNAEGATIHDLGSVGSPYTQNSLGFLNDGQNLLTPYAPQGPHDSKRPLVAFSLWNTATGTLVAHVDGPDFDRKRPGNLPDTYATSPDGKRFALVTRRLDSVIIFRSEDLRIERIIPTRHPNDGGHGFASSVAFSPDGSRLAIGADSAVLLIDLDHPSARPEIISVYDRSRVGTLIESLAFSPDGTMLATGTSSFSDQLLALNPDRVRVWRLRDHELVASFKDGMESIRGMSWNADGRHLAVATGKTVQVLRPLEPESRPSFLYFDKYVMSIEFSPSGQRLAVAAGPVVSIRRMAQ